MIALAAHCSVLARDTGGPTLLKESSEPVRKSIVLVSIENGLVIVNVLINGRGPFPMIFDTGSAGAITSEAAAALGLVAESSGTVTGSGEKTFAVGVTQLRDLRIGDVQLADVVVPVVPFPRFFTDRGARSPVAGIIGYEFLKRFAVRLAYEDATLTITPTQDFRYSGLGLRVPLFLADKLPAITAAADGVAGRFEIDTGSSTAVVLQRAFVEQHGLEIRHPSGLRLKRGGVDGMFDAIVTRLDRFSIGNYQIKQPGVEFPSSGKAGLPVPGVDGSVGYQILRQFVITFDYARSELFLERSAAFGAKTVAWKTGFQAVKADSSSFRVVNVLPNTPAATAAIRIGDVITEVDGRPAGSLGQAEFTDLMQRADGTIVRLGIARDDAHRSVALDSQRTGALIKRTGNEQRAMLFLFLPEATTAWRMAPAVVSATTTGRGVLPRRQTRAEPQRPVFFCPLLSARGASWCRHLDCPSV